MIIYTNIISVDELAPNYWYWVLDVLSLIEYEFDLEIILGGEALAYFEAIKENNAITLVSVDDAWNYIFEDGLASIMNEVPTNGIVSNEKHEEIRAWACETFRVILKDEALMAYDTFMKGNYAKLRGEDEDADYWESSHSSQNQS